MTTSRQRNAARENIRSAVRAARRLRTIKRLPKSTRRALGRQGAKARRRASR